jgi:hypothetical protein
MKLNELITDFSIYVTNEEQGLIETLDRPVPLSSFNERERAIIDNLVRKSVISKVMQNGLAMVIKNDF